MSESPQLMIVNRRGRGEHWYTYKEHIDPSVTTILRAGWPKPSLLYWGINSVARWAADNYSQVYAMGKASPDAVYEFARQVPWSHRDRKGDIGTQVHQAFEDEIPPEALGNEIRPYLEGLLGWFDETNSQVIGREFTVWGTCTAGGYGGKVDILIRHPQLGVGLIDIKTAEKGPYEDDHCQVSAYARAEAGLPERPVWAGILHCRPEATQLHIVEIDKGFDAFCAAYTIARYRGVLTQPEMNT